jgi:hypothetical protein
VKHSCCEYNALELLESVCYNKDGVTYYFEYDNEGHRVKKNGEPNLTNTTKEWLGKHGWATEVRLYK